MVARLQQTIVLALLVLAGLWLAAWWPAHPVWAVGGALALCFGHAGVLALECVAMRSAQARDSRTPVPRWGSVLPAWWCEIWAAPRVFCWQQPFRTHAVPDRLPQAPEDTGPRGVVLVHGLLCNRAFWNPWLRRLQANGQPFIAVSLEPIFAPIDDHVPALDAAVRQITQRTGRAPYVVCHSMGGLVVRAWLRGWEGSGDAEPAYRVVTIGTPHHGTWLARASRSPNGLQMRLGSPWLTALAAAEPASRRQRFTCFYSDCDNVVFPAATATLPDADNRLVPGCPHVGLAFDERVMGAVMQLLSKP